MKKPTKEQPIKRFSIKDRAEKVPLNIKIEVALTFAFLSLPSQLGYRKEEMWSSKEDHKRWNKIHKLAKKEAKNIIKLIDSHCNEAIKKYQKK